ncbi:unnamed protein product [Triticum aestivum]|uniref:Uncharacterized protein n=2 Tax=Triticum TaxID=4564 RepID=A0A9R1QEY3_TRITD|nr:unnamed protein product [Triticum aestivum]VAH75340.1 unnamed protein product [Triticum turgidum subsp. durum]
MPARSPASGLPSPAASLGWSMPEKGEIQGEPSGFRPADGGMAPPNECPRLKSIVGAPRGRHLCINKKAAIEPVKRKEATAGPFRQPKARGKSVARRKSGGSTVAESSGGPSLLTPPRRLTQEQGQGAGLAGGQDATEDPVEEFFQGAKQTLPPPARHRPDAMAAKIDEEIAAKLDKPLRFEDGEDGGSDGSLDMGPTLSLARHTPLAANTQEVQLGAVMQRVTEMQLQEEGAEGALQLPLFSKPAPAIVGKPPARDKTPLKARPQAKPARQSARQAANPSLVPVSQRATLRLVQGLGVLRPKEKMTAQAAEALIRRLDEPLSDHDIAAIAKLTSLDANALKAIAGMPSQHGSAAPPHSPC